MFSFIYETRYGDYKDFDTIKPGTVLDVIQDVSIKDSKSRGYGLDVLREMNLAWLLQGINVSFEKPIKTNSPLEASTAVKSLKRATSERGCMIKQNGELVAKSIASWFLMDTEKMQICKILPEMYDKYEYYDFNDDFFIYKKPKLHEPAEIAYTIRVSNKDIDTNQHLNNQKGADLLMDALPFDFYFNNIRILYKKSAYLGDELDVCVTEIPDGYYVHLQDKDRQICVAGEFVNI